MGGFPTTEHTYKQFDADLESIRNRVLQMGGIVEQQITRGLAREAVVTVRLQHNGKPMAGRVSHGGHVMKARTPSQQPAGGQQRRKRRPGAKQDEQLKSDGKERRQAEQRLAADDKRIVKVAHIPLHEFGHGNARETSRQSQPGNPGRAQPHRRVQSGHRIG